ncbi:MAG TPA: hypothetical protein VGJ81_21610 [Thermoanaerobaculia bacterium]|jgi:hypothetical protein
MLTSIRLPVPKSARKFASPIRIAIFALALASSANAVQVTPGDIITTDNRALFETVPPISELGLVKDGNFILIQDYPPENFDDAYISPEGQIFVNESKLTVYDSSFAVVATPPHLPGGLGEMVWDRSGHIFVGNELGNTIRKLDLNYHLLDTITIAVPQMYFDLAADQCTVYYTDGWVRIHRHDVCTNTALTDVSSTVTDTFNQIRIAADGSIVVAGHQAVYHLSTDGTLINQFDPVPFGAYDQGAIALAPGGNQVWIVGRNGLRLVDLATGNLVQSVDPQVKGDIRSIAVMGDAHAAAAPVPIPTLTGPLLLLLAVSVVAVGLVTP